MDGNNFDSEIESIRLVDKGKYQVPDTKPVFRRWELNLSTKSRPFQDMVNCIAAESEACRLLALATEKGLIYVFNFQKNKMETCIQADHWIGSVVINSHSILISNYAFYVCQYGLRSNRLSNRIKPTTKDREGFGPKGIIFTEINNRGLILFNSGYLKFRIYNTKTRKILKTFSPFEGHPIANHEPAKMVLNYNLNVMTSTLAIILKDDPHLYLWDMEGLKLLSSMKLYEPGSLPRGMNLMSTGLISCRNHFLVLLQFQNPKISGKLSSVLIVISLEEKTALNPAKVVLFEKLSRLD